MVSLGIPQDMALALRGKWHPVPRAPAARILTPDLGMAKTLNDLVSGVAPRSEPSPLVTGITTDSDQVSAGSLFIAIRGTSADGHAFIPEAVARGAVAVVADRDYRGDPGVPVIRVESPRRASAELAAAWHGHPARRLRLVGITGSIGKTSILAMLEGILVEAGRKTGTVGSLGVHVDGEVRSETGHTAPGPLLLQRELARIAGENCDLAAMEVTSHALVQERVHGLRFDAGIFTNLVPLEHAEYHDTFRDYADAKRLFFNYLRPRAPLIYNADSQVVQRLAHETDATPVGCGFSRAARVRIEAQELRDDGSRFTLHVRHPLPAVAGPHTGGAPTAESPTGSFPFELALLGYSNMTNAALAATLALCLGVDPGTIAGALSRVPRQPRRMEVLHRGRFLVLDDTVGHPDSISALFQVVERLRPRRVHIAFAVRGQRGPTVNRHTAEALAIWVRHLPVGSLIVTRSVEATDDRNGVENAELKAVESALRQHGVEHSVRERLDHAVMEVLERAGDGDLVLLLGAQGMDRGQEIARAWLRDADMSSSGNEATPV